MNSNDYTTSRGKKFLNAHAHSIVKKKKIRDLVALQKRYMTELGQFLGHLKSIDDGTGTLLDHTIVLFGSGMGNASSHSNRNLPVLVAGGGFRHGESLKYEPGKIPLCNLYVTLLQKLGVETDSFGNATGTLTGFA